MREELERRKNIKTGKRAGLGGKLTGKRLIIYTAARAKETREMMNAKTDEKVSEVGFDDQALIFGKKRACF